MARKRPEKKSDPIVKYLLENYEINSAQDIKEVSKGYIKYRKSNNIYVCQGNDNKRYI